MNLFEKRDIEKLKKLGVESLLDLALLLPSKYENNYIENSINEKIENVVDATILNLSQTDKLLKIRLFSHNFNKEINGIIFHPKKYHKVVFKAGERFFLKGKIEYSFGSYSLIQPKIIKDINTIEVKYKQKSSKELIKKYITLQNLQKEGLSKKESETVYLCHNPTIQFLKRYQKEGFGKNEIEVFKFVEIYNHIKKLSKKRTYYPSSNKLNGDVKPFIDSLPFRLTNDQLNAIKDIQKDFNSAIASKRVIMGDVACGKTIVILASVVMAYPKRSLLMVPTSILAHQIYQEAKKFLPKSINTILITSDSKKEDLGRYSFIVGTHALMYRDLPECDLVLIDEQHRFGVNQREFIKNIVFKDRNKRAHFLQFSATPIPRTMAMINSSLVDYSFIKEIPFKKEIETKIIKKSDFKKLLEHIKKEVSLNHQVFIIYPLVQESESIEYQSIDEAKSYWIERFENVYVTHGKDKDKESILKEFREKGSILISTTVVEVGISLPKLSTVVIVGAERLGLATLHQIRGRVSRTGLKGYCFLYTNLKNSKRLEEFSKTLNGFDIAELDLKFRQSGDILSGKSQSGQMFKWIDLSKDEDIIKRAKLLLEQSRIKL